MPPKLNQKKQQKSSTSLAIPKNTLHTGLSRTSGAPSTPENTRNENTINNHNILEYPSKYRSKLPEFFRPTHINGRPLSINNNIRNIIEDNGTTILTYSIDYNLKKLSYIGREEFIYYGFTINDILIKTSIQTFNDNIEFYGALNYDTLKMTTIKKQKKNSGQKFTISVNDFKELFKNFVLYQIFNYSKLLTGSGASLNSIRRGTQGLNELQLIKIIKYIYDHINTFLPKTIINNENLKKIYFITVFLKNILIQIKPYSEIMRYIENRIRNTIIKGVTIHQSKRLENEQIKLSRTFLDTIYQERIYNKEQLENFKRIHTVSNDTILDNVFNDLLLFKEVLDNIYYISFRLIKYKDIYTSTNRKVKDSIIEKIYNYGIEIIDIILNYCNDPDHPEYNTPKCIYYRGYEYEPPVEEGRVNHEPLLHEPEESPFIKCYGVIQRLSTNFTNFDFLNNPTIFEVPIYSNIVCIYNVRYFAEYCTQNEPVQYQPVSKNIFKCMPYVLFYYYKELIDKINGFEAGGGAGAGGARPNVQEVRIYIEIFLNISLNLFRTYKYIINYIEQLIPGPMNLNINLNIEDNVYKINKILYKTHKQLYNTIRQNFPSLLDYFMGINDEINNLKRELILIYTQKNININHNNYTKSMIPNFNERNKFDTYKAIRNENQQVRDSIKYLRNEGVGLNNLQAKFNPIYTMLDKRENRFNVNNYNQFVGKHNNNHIFFRKLFNNENLGLQHPLRKFYNHFVKRKI